MRGEKEMVYCQPGKFAARRESSGDIDFKYIKGQDAAKRAMEIAVAGSQNIFLIGPPCSGKTMLARAVPTIMPLLTFAEALEDVYKRQDYISGLELPMEYTPIVKGDAKVYSIAAASIVAKVTRDRIMREYDRKYPEYGFARHKGYGTKAHREAILQYGILDIHRPSFLGKIGK